MPDCRFTNDPEHRHGLRSEATSLRFDPRACLTAPTCVDFQHRAKHLPNSLTWAFPCGSCVVGRARMMDGWTPEPDVEPKHRTVIIPWTPNVEEKNRKFKPRCKCNKALSTSAQYYGTGLCRDCYEKARRGPEKCVTEGCPNKSRRRGLCKRHIRELNDARAVTSLPGSVRLGSTGD